jgi:two-component system, cell cycle response regulator DivK
MAKATILIVEDSPDIAQPLADAFRYADFAVLQASGAVQGLQLAAEAHPQLIIMDIQLPDLDGLSAAQTLKADPATQAIPIVAMTAYDITADQARILGRTCIGHYQKPVRPRDMVNLATAVLKLKEEPPAAPKRPQPARPPGR